MPEPKTNDFMRLLVQFAKGTAQNKEGHLLVALCFYFLCLLASGAVTAAAAGRVSGLARVVAAIALVGHVWVGLDLRLGLRSGATSWPRVGRDPDYSYSRLCQYSSLFGLHWLAWLSSSGSIFKFFTSFLFVFMV